MGNIMWLNKRVGAKNNLNIKNTLDIKHKSKGVTLVELLIVMAILGIVISLAFSMNIFSQRVYTMGEHKSDIQFNLRLASDYITREARYATGVEILDSTATIPDTVTNDDKYIFLDITGKSLIIRDKNGDRTPVNVDGLNILFKTAPPSKTLEFVVSGSSGTETFSLDSKVLILNLPKDQSIVDSAGVNDGVAVRLSNDLPYASIGQLYFTLPAPYGGVIGEYYSKAFDVMNNSGPCTFELTSDSGPLPDGISLSSSGQLSGTPTTAGNFSIYVKATDSVSGETLTRTFNIPIIDPTAVDLPVAENLVISGTAKQGETVTGEYNYVDPEGEDELGTMVRWYRMDNISGLNKTMIKEQEATASSPSTYTLTADDVGKYIVFEVIPCSSDGRLGLPVTSAPPVLIIGNSPPVATNVKIEIKQNLKVGKTLTGSYKYEDAEGDPEGATIIKWYRSANDNGTGLVDLNHSNKNYILQTADIGYYIYFEVTPRAVSGEITGAPVLSAHVGPVIK
jgi:prepilin-type N-terminal cleavage/methylation domain-containing protein